MAGTVESPVVFAKSPCSTLYSTWSCDEVLFTTRTARSLLLLLPYGKSLECRGADRRAAPGGGNFAVAGDVRMPFFE
jgi:hypothetical protein